MTDHSKIKRLPYADKGGKEDETGGKIAPIRQETQVDQTAARDNKRWRW